MSKYVEDSWSTKHFELLAAERDRCKAERDRYRDALERIAAAGCAEYLHNNAATCIATRPDEPQHWCGECIALAALAPNTEGEGT